MPSHWTCTTTCGDLRRIRAATSSATFFSISVSFFFFFYVFATTLSWSSKFTRDVAHTLRSTNDRFDDSTRNLFGWTTCVHLTSYYSMGLWNPERGPVYLLSLWFRLNRLRLTDGKLIANAFANFCAISMWFDLAIYRCINYYHYSGHQHWRNGSIARGDINAIVL